MGLLDPSEDHKSSEGFFVCPSTVTMISHGSSGHHGRKRFVRHVTEQVTRPLNFRNLPEASKFLSSSSQANLILDPNPDSPHFLILLKI
jgi:hypothetical protein